MLDKPNTSAETSVPPRQQEQLAAKQAQAVKMAADAYNRRACLPFSNGYSSSGGIMTLEVEAPHYFSQKAGIPIDTMRGIRS
jgi:hypothetical protein